MINTPTFQNREFPIPIVVADARPPGFAQLSPTPVIPLNSTQYEFTPWELGSYDPDLSAFVDIRFMGTHLISGKPANSSACVTEFDQTSFIFGTSGSVFNVRNCASIPLYLTLNRLSRSSYLTLETRSGSLTQTPAMHYSTFSGEC